MVSGVQLPGVPSPSGGPVRRSFRAQEKRRKQRKRRSRVAVLVALSLLVGAGALVWWGVKPIVESLREPADFPGPGTGSVTITIPEGASGRRIGQILADAGVVKSTKAFVDAASTDSRAAGIRPGTYELRLAMSSTGAIEVLADPDNRITDTFTVAEGKRLSEIVDIIAKAGIPKKDLQAALKNPDELGLPSWAKRKGVKQPLEGFLFPATYEVQPTDTATSVLSAMVARTIAELDAAGVPEKRRYAVLTEASIIQVEGGSAEDFPKVARVIENRLKIKKPLQMDSTVSYAVGRFGITTTSQERASTSRYNTYKYSGLPAGPISNPGADAIRAAEDPADGPWIFFVTVNPDTGLTRFSETEEEHQAAVLEFQKWLRENPQN